MKLLVLWKSNNITDVVNLVLPYVTNSKTQNWFDEVTLLIWGASTEFLNENKETQESVKGLIEKGINVYACKYCSDNLNATETLKALGVNVMYTGVFLSDSLKDDDTKVITF